MSMYNYNLEEMLEKIVNYFKMDKKVEALKLITSLIPPGDDYGLVLGELNNLRYMIDKNGVAVSSTRLEEGLPFLISSFRRIRWELVPKWIIDDLDLCKLLKNLSDINIEWYNISRNIDHPYVKIAEKFIKIDISEICKMLKE